MQSHFSTTWNGCSASLRAIKEPTLKRSTQVTFVDLGEIFDDTESFPAMVRQFTENWNENFPTFPIAQNQQISQSQNPCSTHGHFALISRQSSSFSIQPAIKNNKNTSVRAVSRATRAHIHPPLPHIWWEKKASSRKNTRSREQKEEENKLRKKNCLYFFTINRDGEGEEEEGHERAANEPKKRAPRRWEAAASADEERRQKREWTEHRGEERKYMYRSGR